MDANGKVRYLRHKMREKLKQWIPDNDFLIEKELKIFDKIMNRREFLQTTSVVAASALFYGCSDRHDITQPPSAFDDTKLSDAERTSVKKASKIVVDSDVLDSYGKYNPLAPKGSSDNLMTKDNAVMESFNPHIMTHDGTQVSQTAGLKPLDRNYGISEIVHLDKESNTKNYKLSIFEKDFYTQSLKESSIELENTVSLNLNKLIAANGNYHNRVQNKIVYSQKMLLMSNIDDKTNPDMRLYYQVASSPLLKAGVEAPKNSEWKYLDIINLFKTNEKDYSFKDYLIVDIDSYEDGSNNNFIYGTIQFDDFYSYGFIVTFSKIDATEPTVSFFTPKYLSKESNVIENLKADFENLDINTDVQLKEFSLFSSQKFIPFAQVDNEVLFSFVSIDTASDYYGGEVYPDEYGSYDLSSFTDTSAAMVKRYLISVDSSKGGVAYLLDSYTMDASISVADDVFTLNFNTSTIPTIDIWSIFKTNGVSNAMATVQFKDSFVRYVKDEDTELHIMLSSSILSESDIGVIHKSVKLNYSDVSGIKENFVLGENLESKSLMDASSFDGHEYKTMWFDDMKNSSIYSSLSDCANGDNGHYKFYSAHNHQGLLRSYFVIKVGDTNILLNFNEQGLNPESTTEPLYNSQDYDSLYVNIKSDNVAHFPPLPINANVKGVLKWRSVGQDEEVVFSAMRPTSVNSETNTLQENSDNTLHSYFHANLDALDGGWNTHEIEQHTLYEKSKNNIYKISKHQVHLHVNNIYDYPAELEENVYIEVRFASSVIVTDHTDTANPKTYHTKRDTSLFFKPKASVITLEVSSGSSNEDIFNGATMMYRFSDMSDFELESNQPIATLTSVTQNTTEFMQCNISFRQFERLTTKNVNSYQAVMRPDELSNPQTPQEILYNNAKEDQKDNIIKVTDLYQNIYESALPQNDLAPASVGAMVLRSSGCCHSFHKWVHKAVSTIKHSAKHVKKEIATKAKKALEKLVDDIDTLAKDVSHSMHTMLTSLMVLINKIVKVSKDFILYLESFWRLVRGFIGIDTAWKIGEELHQLERDQLSPDSTVEGNAYSIIKAQTEVLEKDINDIAKTFKSNIDNVIDKSLDTTDGGTSTHLKSAKNTQNHQQQNSTKHYHLIHQIARLHHKMNLDNPKDDDKVDNSAFVCDASDTVEQLFKCISTEEGNKISDDMKRKLKNSEKLFYDLIDGEGMSAVKEDLATLLKDSADDMADEIATVGKGALQIPLAFLNGSSSITLAEEALDDVLSEVFELLSFILFGDKDKIKTVQDVGYFLAGFEIYVTLSLYEETLHLSNGESFDSISYMKSGDFRNDVNRTTVTTSLSSSSNHEESTAFVVMQVIDGIASAAIPAFNWLSKRGEPLSFFILRKIVSPVLIVIRMIAHSLVFKKHADADLSIYIGTARVGDIFHFVNLILQLFQQFLYKYINIVAGIDTNVYNLTIGLHILLFCIESLINLMASVLIPQNYFGTITEAKKANQIEKRVISLLGSVFSAMSDTFSGNSEEENAMSGVVVLNAIAFGGAVICGIANLGLSLSYLNQRES